MPSPMRPLALAISLLAFVVVSYAQDDYPCPTPLGGGSVHDGSNRFEYRSWKRQDAKVHSTFVYCTCVQNPTAGSLFVDWTGTHLRGFVEPHRTIYSYEPSTEDTGPSRTSTLWYGSHHSLNVDTMLHPPLHHEGGNGSALQALHSHAVLSVPDLVRIKRSGIDPRKAFALVAEDPKLLAAVTVDFESTVVRDAAGKALRIQHKCMYYASAPMLTPYYETPGLGFFEERPLVHAAFKDPELQRVMFDDDHTVPLLPWGKPQDTYRSVTLTRDTGKNVRIAHTSLEIVNSLLPRDSDEYILASIPVTYYVATSQERSR